MSQQPWMQQPQNNRPKAQQIQVTINLAEDILVCQCGGLGVIFNAGFLPKHNIAAIGAKPEIVTAPILICSSCGQRMTEPWTRAGDIKEAK